jgi:hypothetical protein
MAEVSESAKKAAAAAALANRVSAAVEYIEEHGLKSTKRDKQGKEVELSAEEALEKAERIRKARSKAAQVLSRGRTLDTLDRVLAHVPDGYVGQLVRESDVDIDRFEILGFEVFTSEKAKKESSHGTADGKVRVGDQILMTMPEEDYAALQYEKQLRVAKKREAHKPEARRRQFEAETDPDVPTFSEVS